MKRLGLLLLCFLLVSRAWSQDHPESLMKSELDRYEQLRLFKKSTAGDNYDVLYHRIHWNINPHRDSMSGSVTTYFNTRTAGFISIAFDFIDGMRTDSVKYHLNHTTFNHAGDILLIDLPAALPVDAFDSVTVYYSGDPTQNGNTSYAREKSRPKNDHPVIWTLSQPYGAMTWWPCKQTLSDKIDSLDIFVTVPQGNKAASIGLLVDSVKYDTFITYHWKHRYPIVTYLVAVAVTNYSEFSDYYHFGNGDSLEILNYFYPESVASMREPAKTTPKIMAVFDSLFGVYPFALEKYGHAQFGRGGGMEHQTMSFMVDLNFELVAHELAHQWFGDATTCRTWSDIWLNEGFATFLSIIAYENLTPQDLYRRRAAESRDAVLKEPGGSVYVADTLDRSRLFSSRLTYHKGAMMLQMLRFRLGDSVFYSAVKKYLNAPEHRYGFARTDDLIAFLEAESGQDLDLFFDQWFYGEGYPNIQVAWRRRGAYIEVTLQQTTSHTSVAFFDTPLPVQFSGEGKDTLIVFHPDSEKWTTILSLDFDPEEVVVDPDVRILAKTAVVKLDDMGNKAILYPNPSMEVLHYAAAPFEVQRIEVYDMAGARILDLDNLPAGRNYGEFDISVLAAGIYVVRLHGDGESSDVKFFKQNP